MLLSRDRSSIRYSEGLIKKQKYQGVLVQNTLNNKLQEKSPVNSLEIRLKIIGRISELSHRVDLITRRKNRKISDNDTTKKKSIDRIR